MRIQTLVLLPLLLFIDLNVASQPQLSPLSAKLYKFCNTWSASGHSRKAITQELMRAYQLFEKQGELYVGAFIEFDDDTAPLLWQKYKLHQRARAGNICTVDIPLHQYVSICKEPSFRLIEIGEPLYPVMWETLQETAAISLHKGLTPAGVVTGKGVMIGVIDIGFDFTHPNFYDLNGERLRVKAIWAQEDTTGTPPPNFNYGHFIEGEEGILKKGFDEYGKSMFHGSHTAGIASGSGYGTQGRHTGIAPDAELILVSSSLRSDRVADATKFIFDYASKQGKPAVINMSFGSWWGAMDGTKLLDRMLSDITGRGKIIVAAMGNEGNFNQHISYTFQSKKDTLKTIENQAQSGPNRNPTVIECWGQPGINYKASVGLVNKHGNIAAYSNEFSLDGQAKDDTSDWGALKIGVTTYRQYPGNLRPYTEIRLFHNTDTLEPVLFATSEHAGSNLRVYCPFVNLKNRYTDEGTPWPGYTAGDSLSSGRSPGVSALRVVSVGAYVDKNKVYSFDGGIIDIPTSENPFSLGQYAPFSSRGPSLDGRLKPDVTAPGVVLVSSYNSFIPLSAAEREVLPRASEAIFDFRGRTYHWVFASGTSMATPVVTGTVALMLQINPNLDYFDVVRILHETAKSDSFTGNNLPLNSWGYGKVDAKSAVLKTLIWADSLRPLAYPVPFQNTLTISGLNKFSPQATVELIDTKGKAVLLTKLNDNNTLIWETSSLAAGMYYLRIKDFKTSRVLKLIKQN